MNGADIENRIREGLQRLARSAERPAGVSRTAWRFDVALAVGLAIAALSTLYGGRSSRVETISPLGVQVGTFIKQSTPFDLGDVLTALFATLPLASRRRYPLGVLGVVVVSTAVMKGDSAAPEVASCVVAAYSAVAYGRRQLWAYLSLLAVGAVLSKRFNSVIPTIPKVSLAFFLIVPIAAAGVTIRTLRARAEEGQARMRAMELEQEETTRRAVELERSRIARELHDVVTHNVSVMVVQAGAARKVLAASPEQATEALLAVEASGRAAMAELRQAMGLLNSSDDVELAPQPGVDQLPTLVGRVRDAGLPVTLSVTGTPRPMPEGIGLAAYRVVQEALTNTVKHAVGASARVAVAYGPDVLRVEIADTGGVPGRSAETGNGRGLLGLRERLAVYGGTLDAEPRLTGGFRVVAVIPLAGAVNEPNQSLGERA